MTEGMILQNAIQLFNGSIIISVHVHDYIKFEDAIGDIYAIDGGNDYLQQSGDPVKFPGKGNKDLRLTTLDSLERIRDELVWGTRGPNGDQPVTYMFMKDMTYDHLKALKESPQYPNLSKIRQQVINHWLAMKSTEAFHPEEKEFVICDEATQIVKEDLDNLIKKLKQPKEKK